MSKMTFWEFKRKVDFKGKLNHIGAEDLCGEKDWARRVVYNILTPILPEKREFPEALITHALMIGAKRYAKPGQIETKIIIADLRRIWERSGGAQSYCEHCSFGYTDSAQVCLYCHGTGDRRQRQEDRRTDD